MAIKLKARRITDLETIAANLAKDFVASERAIAVGINGIDCSGKTSFAERLKAALEKLNVNATLLHVDDFNDIDVQAESYTKYHAGRFDAAALDKYCSDGIRYADLYCAISELKKSEHPFIAEGVFLFIPSHMFAFHLRIFLDVDVDTARCRYAVRKDRVGDMRPIRIFEDICVPAFKQYSAECRPRDRADYIIDTSPRNCTSR